MNAQRCLPVFLFDNFFDIDGFGRAHDGSYLQICMMFCGLESLVARAAPRIQKLQ